MRSYNSSMVAHKCQPFYNQVARRRHHVDTTSTRRSHDVHTTSTPRPHRESFHATLTPRRHHVHTTSTRRKFSQFENFRGVIVVSTSCGRGVDVVPRCTTKLGRALYLCPAIGRRPTADQIYVFIHTPLRAAPGTRRVPGY